MSSRLQELLRQKAMLAEHAAWLDREIAREQAQAGAPVPAAPPPMAPATVPMPAAPVPSADLDAEAAALIQQYGDAAHSSHERIRTGCILYIVAAVILALLPFLAVYFFYHH